MNQQIFLPQRRPDFEGGGIINLMASVIRGQGGQTQYPEARLLPATEIAGFRHLVLLIIDGLGANWLLRQSPDGFLSQHFRGSLTSVFPATTATAITSYLTGEAPQQHGLTGWHTWLRELGCVISVLPGKPRYGGVGYRQAGVDVGQLYGLRSIYERISRAGVSVTPESIAHSDFNRALLGPAQLRGYEPLAGLFKAASKAIKRAREPSYVYAYWPGLDSIGHNQGIGSAKAQLHLAQLEAGIEQFVQRITGTGTLVLVCADHGQIDTTPADEVQLEAHPGIADCLAMPLCGEPRAAFCYLRPGTVEAFKARCAKELGERFQVIPSQALLEAGFFGFGEPHPRLSERIGDYCLIGREHWVIRDRMRFEKPHKQIGVHGGLSEDELLVPLIAIPC